MKLLVVNDSSIVRKITNDAASKLGYEQLESTDISQALSVLQINYRDIELIIFDWNLAKTGKLEFLRLIKSNVDYAKIPILVTFTEIKKDSLIKAKELGVSCFVLKPFNIHEITINILDCIGKKK